jgi:hypothetical protein
VLFKAFGDRAGALHDALHLRKSRQRKIPLAHMQGLPCAFAHDLHVQQSAANGAFQGLGLLRVRQNSLAAHHKQVAAQASLRQIVPVTSALTQDQVER